MSNTCRTDERCPHLRTIARPLTLLSLVFAGCINDTLIGRDPDVGSIVDQGIPDTRDVIATLDAFDASDVVDAPIVDVANISEAGDAGPDVAPTDIPVIVDGGPGTGTLRVTGCFCPTRQ